MEGEDGRMWWRHGVLYQVYPRSYQDSDGDGVGDLEGVRRRLGHLRWLGVDGIWLNPIHPSPGRDWGYDVADYRDVAGVFGGMEALRRLIDDAAALGIRVMLDLVPNHTSDRHPWFLNARGGRDAEHRDRYVWSDPAPDGGPPNNWRSAFGGPAWTLDPRSGQYYLHNFLPAQPDLNWWNEDVRAAFDDIVRFWFDRGIAGFRIDVAHAIVKDHLLRDDPVTSGEAAAEGEHAVRYSMHRPEVHDVLRRWRGIADSYDPSRVLIGETWVRDLPELARYYGEGRELHLAFNFAFAMAPFEAAAIRSVVEATERALGDDAWPLYTASNHDIGRLATRWAGGDDARVRCALFVLLLLRGTPVLYAGDEIGLENVPVTGDARRDPGSGPDGDGRDGGRTPMPWEPGEGHGFTEPGVAPWLPFGGPIASVAEQRDDAGSVLSWCRRVIELRRNRPDLTRGAQRFLDAADDVLAWQRGSGTTVVANLSSDDATAMVPEGTIELASEGTRTGEAGEVSLPSWGCAVLGRRHRRGGVRDGGRGRVERRRDRRRDAVRGEPGGPDSGSEWPTRDPARG